MNGQGSNTYISPFWVPSVGPPPRGPNDRSKRMPSARSATMGMLGS
jgi:hypothetical protein